MPLSLSLAFDEGLRRNVFFGSVGLFMVMPNMSETM